MKSENEKSKMNTILKSIVMKTPLRKLIDRINELEDFVYQRTVQTETMVTGYVRRIDEDIRRIDEDIRRIDEDTRRIDERMADDDKTTSALMENIRGLNKDTEVLQEQVKNLNMVNKWINRQVTPAAEAAPEKDNPSGFAQETAEFLFYHDFEECFRGNQNQIRRRLSIYMPVLQSHFGDIAEKTFLDVGCGRGEWLDLLMENGVKDAVGIDLNEVQIEIAKNRKHNVLVGDCIKYLVGCENSSIDVITGFQIIEHLSLADLLSLFYECFRALKPNGMVIFETPNSGNLITAASNFYIDPTHQRPVHASLAEFLLMQSGFSDVRIIESVPMDEAQWLRLPETGDNLTLWNENINKLNALLYGPQDYAAIGIKKGG